MPRATARRRAIERPDPDSSRDAWNGQARYAASAPAQDDPYEREYSSATVPHGFGDAYMHDYAAEYDDYGHDAGYSARTREHSQARPLPSAPQYERSERYERDDQREQYDQYDQYDQYERRDDYREPVAALVPVAAPLAAYAPLPADSAPELAAYRPIMRAPHRTRLDTRALRDAARNPWTVTRLALALIAMALAFFHTPGQMGEQAQPLMIAHAQAGLTPGGAITSLVQPETQLLRPDLYDSYAQFQNWGGAACSAAALSEILTAYGVPHATIGHEIDELGHYISPYGGLLNRHGFAVVAAMHNLRADESTSLTYNQIVYLSEQLGMPVIVNVRISYGYYHFFDGGHFLTVIGGDAQGLRIVDSSEYYIHYLPKDVFYQMFTGYTAAIVPMDYQYSLPAN